MKYILNTPRWLVKGNIYKNKCNVYYKETFSVQGDNSLEKN